MVMTRRIVGSCALLAILFLAACSSGPLKIGVLLPESGYAKAYGDEIRRGVDLAAQDLGPIDGRPVEILYRDTAADPQKAAEQFLSLVEEGAYAVIGPLTNREISQVAALAEENEVIVVTPSAGGPDQAFRTSWTYTLRAAAGLEATKLATLARSLSPPIKYVSLAWAKGAYGQEFKDEFIKAFEQQKGEVLTVRNFAMDLQAPQAEKLALSLVEERPDAVIIVSPLVQDVVSLSAALRGVEYEARIMTTSMAAMPSILNASAEAVEGLYLTVPSLDWERTPEAKAFARAYRADHGGEPTLWAAYAYDAVGVLKAALEVASTYPSDTVSTLRRTTDFPGAGGVISFDNQGRVVRTFHGYQVREGKLVQLP